MEQSEFCTDTQNYISSVSDAYHNVRLDHYLVQMDVSGFSRSQISESIKLGSVTVNRRVVKPGYRLKSGDVVSGFINVPISESRPIPQQIPFDILYEDPSIIVIAKPPGLVVHPGSGNQDHTLVNGLLYYFQELAEVGDPGRPGIVHRLDKDTSGVMVIARNMRVHQRLVQDFKDRNIQKEYLALVHGVPGEQQGRIVAPLGRHPVNRQKMAIREIHGKYAVTSWNIKTTYTHYSLLQVRIETGRTHQIRVHLAHIRHPVAGDRVYGPGRNNLPFQRQMLHSWKLTLDHPESGKPMTFEAPLTSDFTRALKTVEK